MSLILGQIRNKRMAKAWSLFAGVSIGFYIYGQNYSWNIGNIAMNCAFMHLLPRT